MLIGLQSRAILFFAIVLTSFTAGVCTTSLWHSFFTQTKEKIEIVKQVKDLAKKELKNEQIENAFIQKEKDYEASSSVVIDEFNGLHLRQDNGLVTHDKATSTPNANHSTNLSQRDFDNIIKVLKRADKLALKHAELVEWVKVNCQAPVK